MYYKNPQVAIVSFNNLVFISFEIYSSLLPIVY